MELLIVGAGAVGAVYGYFASRRAPSGGARVTYLVKPKHLKDLERGLRLYHWRGKRAETVIYRDFRVISSMEEVKRERFDAVLVTIPADKFRHPGWLDGLLEASGDAEIWSLQPDANAQELLRTKMTERFGPDAAKRIVVGRIPIMSYLAPLPGESFAEPGFAFFVPPGSPALWKSEDPAAAAKAAALFAGGGLPAKTAPFAKPENPLPETLLRCVVAGLERCEWSFDRFRNGENIQLAAGAMREMGAILAKRAGIADPTAGFLGRLVASPFGIRAALRIVSAVAPFDFEAFLRVHFGKVEGQMHLALDETIADGKKYGVSTTNLVLLRGRARKTG